MRLLRALVALVPLGLAATTLAASHLFYWLATWIGGVKPHDLHDPQRN